MSGPAGEVKLTTARLLECAGETIKVDEAVVSLCLQPSYLPDLRTIRLTEDRQKLYHQDEEHNAAYLALLRTGAIFVVEHEEISPAFASDLDAPLEELPPLPFPRVLVEARHRGEPSPLYEHVHSPGETADQPAGDVAARHLLGRLHDYEHRERAEQLLAESQTAYVVLIGIVEREEGAVWDVLTATEWAEPTRDRLSAAGIPRFPKLTTSWQRLRATVDGVAGVQTDLDEAFYDEAVLEPDLADLRGTLHGWRERTYQRALSSALTTAYLIEANAPRVEIALPRAQRRRLETLGRDRRVEGPRIYFLDVARAAEERTGKPSGRKVGVRFLVRGHWRRSDAAGSVYRPEKQAFCVRVKSHIRGPAGAPWKGRPVHVLQEAAG